MDTVADVGDALEKHADSRRDLSRRQAPTANSEGEIATRSNKRGRPRSVDARETYP